MGCMKVRHVGLTNNKFCVLNVRINRCDGYIKRRKFQRNQGSELSWGIFLMKRKNVKCNVKRFCSSPDVSAFSVCVFTNVNNWIVGSQVYRTWQELSQLLAFCSLQLLDIS